MSLNAIYQTIKARLALYKDDSDQNLFEFIEVFNDQPQKAVFEASADASGKPSAFIQFKESSFEELKNDIQRRNLTFCIHISQVLFDNTGKVRSDAILQFNDFLSRVNRDVSCLKVDGFTKFVRTKEEHFVDTDAGESGSEDAEIDKLYTQIITYETVQFDASAIKTFREARITGVVINKNEDPAINADIIADLTVEENTDS